MKIEAKVEKVIEIEAQVEVEAEVVEVEVAVEIEIELARRSLLSFQPAPGGLPWVVFGRESALESDQAPATPKEREHALRTLFQRVPSTMARTS